MFHRDIPLSTADAVLSDSSSCWADMPVGRVHYKSIGTGPTVVLVHNSGMWGGIWDEWVPLLTQKFRVIVPDLPGFGLTGPVAGGDYSYDALAHFLCDFVEQLAEPPVHLVGLSLGGQLAWRCALLKPDLVASLVLINPTGYPEKSLPAVFKLARGPMGWLLRFLGSTTMIRKNLAQLWGKGAPISDAFLGRLLVSQCRAGNRKAFLTFLRTDNESLHTQIPSIRKPVQLQWSVKCGPERFSHDLPDVELVIHDDFGHLPVLEAPEQTAETAMRFIETHDKETRHG